MVATASAGFWPKYSWNSEGMFRNCECHEVEFESPYASNEDCLAAYKSEEGVHGDYCGREYPETETCQIMSKKEDITALSTGKNVEQEAILPNEAKNCHDLVEFYNTNLPKGASKLALKDVLVHRAEGKDLTCDLYGSEVPLCEHRRGCNVLEYSVPTASNVRVSMGVPGSPLVQPDNSQNCNDLITYLNANKTPQQQEYTVDNVVVVRQNGVPTSCAEFGATTNLCDTDINCSHLQYTNNDAIVAIDGSFVMGGFIALLAAF